MVLWSQNAMSLRSVLGLTMHSDCLWWIVCNNLQLQLERMQMIVCMTIVLDSVNKWSCTLIILILKRIMCELLCVLFSLTYFWAWAAIPRIYKLSILFVTSWQCGACSVYNWRNRCVHLLQSFVWVLQISETIKMPPY